MHSTWCDELRPHTHACKQTHAHTVLSSYIYTVLLDGYVHHISSVCVCACTCKRVRVCAGVRMFCVASLCISAAIPHSALRVVPGEVSD